VNLVGTLYENNYQHFEELSSESEKNFIVSEYLQGL